MLDNNETNTNTNTDTNTSSKNKETNSKEQKTKKAAELKETTMARTEGIDTLVSTREDRFSNIISLLIIFTIIYWSVATMYLIIKTS